MFPWEHLAVGYLCYSLLVHLRGRTPDGRAVLALAFGTQFPDLVDKPLSWALDVLPAGVLTHSLFVALPLSVLVLMVARRRSRTELGLAFVVGYLSHLPGDVFPSLVFGDRLRAWFLFWPAVPRPGVDVSDPIVGPGAGSGLLTNAAYYFGEYVDVLLGPRGMLYVTAELLMLGAILALWLYDGRPGVATLERYVGRGRSSS